MPRWWISIGAVAWACSGNEPHPCDAGTPTCDSLLTIKLPDPRVDFALTVTDNLGMDVQMQCPAVDTGATSVGEYEVRCFGGRMTIGGSRTLGSEVTVQLNSALPETFTPVYSKGGDFCGNECDQGTIQL